MNPTPAAESPAPHPIFGELLVIPPQHEAEAIVARLRHWNSSLKPFDLYESWLAQHVVRETFLLERLHQREIAIRVAQARQAELHWEEDQRSAARALASGLARHPALVLAQLRHTKHGCELVAARWDTLLAALDRRGHWTAPERLLALNLLDVPPDLRDAPSPLDAPDGDDPLAHLKSVAASEAQHHRELATRLAEVDAIQREAARLGVGPDSPELLALRKEERAADRRLAWTRSQFKTPRASAPQDSRDRPAYTPPRPREAPFPPAEPEDSAIETGLAPPRSSAPDQSSPPAAHTQSSDTQSPLADPLRPPKSSPTPPIRRRRA